MGRGPARPADAAGSRAARRAGGHHPGDLESVRRRTAAAGHWSLLVGYGGLPWVAAAVIRLRQDPLGWPGWAAVVFWIALAGLTPTGLILAAVVALVGIAAPGRHRPTPVRRRRAGDRGAGALPWSVAALIGGALSSPQSSGWRRSPPAPNPHSARWAASRGSAASGMPRRPLLADDTVRAAGHRGAIGGGGPRAADGAAPPAGRAPARAGGRGVLLPAAMATGPGLAAARAVIDAVPGLG